MKKEAICLSGTGFKDWFFARLQKKSSFIIDETVSHIGNQHFWLWFCIEPVHSSVIESISWKRETWLLLKNLIIH